MTVEIFEPAPIYTIQNAGPYAIPHPYETGTIRVAVIQDGSISDLDPTDFTVTPPAAGAGGSVHLRLEIATTHHGGQLTIWRETPEEQGWVGVLGEREKGLEAQLDRIVMILQEQGEQILRSVRTATRINPFVPIEGRTIIFKDGHPVAGPRLGDIANAEQFADRAEAAADKAKASADAAAGHAAAMGDAINAPYTLPEDRLSLPATNGAPLDDDLTPGTQTFTDEIRENYAAPPPGVVNAAARATGLIVFDPPSQESANYVYTDVPWFTHRGSTFRALPVDISATVFNSLVGPCLFEPVATNSWGMLVWRYIGDKPIHSFLQGQMAMRVRTSGTANDAFHKLVLNLRTWDAPHMEAGGQSNGRRFLSTFIGSYQQPVKMTDYEGMNDECLPLTQAVWTAHSAEADRFVGYDNGYFDESSGEVLLTTEGGSPVGSEVRTTKWIDVSDIDASERCLAVWVAGKSRRSRMQWKDSNGDVHFYPVMSRDQHCRRVFRLPHGAQEVRFYYSGPGDDVSSIAVKRMGPENSAEHDPLKGFWYDAQFAFGRDVTLWPGAEYAFDLLTLVYNDASGREWAFRDYGSGFSMPFDATDFLRETASRYFGS